MRSAALLSSLIVASSCTTADDGPVRVGAASGVARAFEALSSALHLDAKYAFAATGLLTRQLEQGAPYDVFIAADTASIERVVKAGVCDGATLRVWARGRVALVAREGVSLPQALPDLADARFARIAIANPETAPYGSAALQALDAAGVASAVKARLVPADNALQALQFVDTGNADVGFVALSLLPPKRPMLLVDAALHRPLDLGAVLCGPVRRRAKGQAFLDALSSREAQALLGAFGYESPVGARAPR